MFDRLGPAYIQSNAILSNIAVYVQVGGCSGHTGVAVVAPSVGACSRDTFVW